MITTGPELQITQERIAYFQRVLAQLRVTATPANFPLMASGYRAEIERMQAEVLEYLTREQDLSRDMARLAVQDPRFATRLKETPGLFDRVTKFQPKRLATG